MELNEWLTQLSAELGTDDVELDHRRCSCCSTWPEMPLTASSGLPRR